MDVLQLLTEINAKPDGDSFKPHKPLLLLIALSRLRSGKPRLAPFVEYDAALKSFQDVFGTLSAIPPFGRLVSDGVWEVTGWDSLQRNSSDDLIKADLLARDVHGGLTKDAFDLLKGDDLAILGVTEGIINKFIAPHNRATIRERLALFESSNEAPIYAPPGSQHCPPRVDAIAEPSEPRGRGMRNNSDFIAYLNSLHSLGASGANALAESQAVNPYFGDLYEPFPLAEPLTQLLEHPSGRVVILSGHAGDGKSTIALEVYKALGGLDAKAPLSAPLREREPIERPSGRVTIVKDMSELSAAERQAWLSEAFTEGSGSWLIVSNTGPLLNSLRQYAKDRGLPEVEDDILRHLDQPLVIDQLNRHVLSHFEKELVILNLSRLDNTDLGARLLGRLVEHPGWAGCAGCSVHASCPIYANRQGLKAVGQVAQERVRWLYRRISQYEKRLTLRQIVAQLAFALTGGLGCAQAGAAAQPGTAVASKPAIHALGNIVFSEGFFGFQGGKPYPPAHGLRAIELARRMHFGGPVSAEHERVMQADGAEDWVDLPESLRELADTWRKARRSPPKRAALRRLLLIFGLPRAGRERESEAFIDTLLRSPGLRLLDQSREQGHLALGRIEAGHLRDACLDVLREAFSGFTASQFDPRDHELYLTLRRPDRAVVQPTQLVVGSLAFRDFDLEYDPEARLPALVYRRRRGDPEVRLTLSLPLLDYILKRADGELATGLDPIHQAQLDGYQARLLSLDETRAQRDGDITLLRADISGSVEVYRYVLDKGTQGTQPRLVKQR